MNSATPDKKIPDWVWNVVRFAVIVALFGALVGTGQLDPRHLREVLSSPAPFLGGVFCVLLSCLFSVFRWRKLLEVQALHVRLGDAVRLMFIGLFFSTVIPGAVSGDAVKAYYVVRGRDKKAEAIVSILMDRILGLYTMVVVAAVVVTLGWTTNMTGAEAQLRSDGRVQAVAVFMWALFAAMTLAFSLAANTRLRRSTWVAALLDKLPFRDTIRSLYDAFYLHGHYPKLFLQALGYSFVAQAPLYAGILCMSWAVNAEGISVGSFLFIFPVGLIVNALPILPGGLGQGEAAFAWLFGLFQSDRGAEVAFLFHAAILLIAVGIGGILYLLGKKEYDVRAAI